MLKLRDIMTANVITLSPELTIREAMELFAARHVSGAPVVTGGELVGVISSTDLLSFVASLPDVTPGQPAEESALWGQDGETGWNEETEPAAKYFSALWEGIDLGEALAADIEGPARNALDEHSVAEAMTRTPVYAMQPETGIDTAADVMRRTEVHRLLVMDGPTLVGIVSTMDIVRAVARHRLTAAR